MLGKVSLCLLLVKADPQHYWVIFTFSAFLSSCIFSLESLTSQQQCFCDFSFLSFVPLARVLSHSLTMFSLNLRQGHTAMLHQTGPSVTQGVVEGTKLLVIMRLCWNPLMCCEAWLRDICFLGASVYGLRELFPVEERKYKCTLLCVLNRLKGGAASLSFWSLCWQAMEC